MKIKNINGEKLNIAMVRLYCGDSGKKGYYNLQEVGLAKALTQYNFNIYICILKPNLKETQEEKVQENITILYVPEKKIFNHGILNCKVLLDYDIQVVHLQSDNQLYAPYVMKFCKKNKIFCYNYVGTIYSDTNNIVKHYIMNFFSKRNIRYFKKYLTFAKTPYVRKALIKEGVKNVEVVPVGLDLDVIPQIMEGKSELRDKLSLPVNKHILLFVGRLEEYKRPLAAVELMSCLSEDYCLVMIGKGSYKQRIIQNVEKASLNSKFIFIDQIPNKEIHKYYKATDFYVNFNEKEIFGMSILEAMYQGCVVVAIDAPGPNYIVQNGESGYVCRNITEMKTIIEKVDNLLGSNATKRIKPNFSWEASAQQLVQYIHITEIEG